MNPALPEHPFFAPYHGSILAAAKPCADIALVPADTLAPWQSKLGGLPYLPQGTDYPHDPQGRPLYLLAQINFADTPPLPDFPRQGILQFFIAKNGLWGMDYHRPERQGGFCVRYYADAETNPAALVSDFSFLPPLPVPPAGPAGKLCNWFKPKLRLPFSHPCAMRFTLGQSLPHLDDPGLHLYGEDLPDIRADNWMERLDDDAADAYADAVITPAEEHGEGGHRLGGYAYHIQGNFRSVADSPYRDHILLLQLNSDRANGLMWGDLGVCHFFIRPDDLRRRDFSRVVYSWECY